MARPENQQGRLAIDESLANAQSAVRTCVRVGSGVSQGASDAIAASITASLTNKKSLRITTQAFDISGARSWTRTNDPLINSQVL